MSWCSRCGASPDVDASLLCAGCASYRHGPSIEGTLFNLLQSRSGQEQHLCTVAKHWAAGGCRATDIGPLKRATEGLLRIECEIEKLELKTSTGLKA